MRLWISALLLLTIISPIYAQSEVSLEVTSDPPGTTVHLEGEYKLTGVTPTVFTQPLSGTYLLTAERPGYETYKTKLYLTGGSPLAVNVELSPKSRFKAFMRSMVLPGWGQYYAGEKSRGAIFGVATLASGIGLIIAEREFQDKKDAYDDVYELFQEERSIEIKRLLENAVDRAREEAYDAEKTRNIVLGIGAAVWAYNLIDVLFFFPDKRYESYVPRVSFDTNEDFSRLDLSLNFSF